jgi:hypothetical protein
LSLILPVSGAALRHVAEQKRIPPLQIGRRVIVPREPFKKWMEQECGMAGNPSMGVMAAWCSQYTITQRESTKAAVQNRAAPWDHNHVRIYFRLHSAAAGGYALCVPRGPVRDSHDSISPVTFLPRLLPARKHCAHGQQSSCLNAPDIIFSARRTGQPGTILRVSAGKPLGAIL